MSADIRQTPQPLRFVFQSYDKLCHISMRLQWTDELGERQAWSSWEDGMCGFYGGWKLLPAGSTDIQVTFRAHCSPKRHRVRAVDRQRRCAWGQGEELIRLRGADSVARGVDVCFELRGPLLCCYVWKAWNALNEGAPEAWEAWPNFPEQFALPAPRVLQAADSAAPWARACDLGKENLAQGNRCDVSKVPQAQEEGLARQVASALLRLHAAAGALLEVRKETLAKLRELDAKLTRQWYGVNSTNTVAAGLAVASVATLIAAPPVGIALGVGSASVGIGATTGDVVGDHMRGNSFVRAVLNDLYEQLAFESVEEELQVVLHSAVASGNVGGNALKDGSVQALRLGAQSATLAIVRASRVVAATRAGQGLSAAGKVIGVAGAGLALGIAVHGWSTTKPSQKMVKGKREEVERSIDYLATLVKSISGGLECSLCQQRLDFGERRQEIQRCQQFHCFHMACLQAHRSPKAGSSCPLCDQQSGPAHFSTLGSSAERLRTLLWHSGVRAPAQAMLAPQVLSRGQSLVAGLRTRAKELQSRYGQARQGLHELAHKSQRGSWDAGSGANGGVAPRLMACRTMPSAHLPEDASTHEMWLDAMEAAGGSLLAINRETLEDLLGSNLGVPLKYRLACWPQWLAIKDRKAAAKRDFSCLLAAAIPKEIAAQVEADIPRTRGDLVPECQQPALRRVLSAWCAYAPGVGYCQGMNVLAAVFLKLGFDEDTAFWMLVAVLEDFLPGCHDPDLGGLFRDAGVAQVLLQTVLPEHAEALAAAGIEPLWVAIDYFVTLGARDVPLALLARLWDFCFLHGPRAVFCGLMAYLDLFLPLTLDRGKAAAPAPDSEVVFCAYRAASRAGDHGAFAARMAGFLKVREGITSELSIGGLRAQLGRQDPALDGLEPEVLAGAKDFATAMAADARSLTLELDIGRREAPFAKLWSLSSTAPPASARCPAPLQDRATLALWEEALSESPGSVADLPQDVLSRLLLRGRGVPMEHRRTLWPAWLQVDGRMERARFQGQSFEELLATAGTLEPPDRASELPLPGGSGDAPYPACTGVTVAADDPRLLRLLRALRTYCPGVTGLQGEALIASVFLDLGFEEEVAFWMLVAVLEDLLQGCHQASAEAGGPPPGLLRDAAVAQVLLQAFGPKQPGPSALLSAGMRPLDALGDFLLTLGASGAPVAAVAWIWDLCFLHGARAVFACLLARLEVALAGAAAGVRRDPPPEADEGLEASVARLAAFRAAWSDEEPGALAGRCSELLLSDGPQCISWELVAGLRSLVGTFLAEQRPEQPAARRSSCGSTAYNSDAGDKSDLVTEDAASLISQFSEPNLPELSP